MSDEFDELTEDDFDQQLLTWLSTDCDRKMVEQLAGLVEASKVEN